MRLRHAVPLQRPFKHDISTRHGVFANVHGILGAGLTILLLPFSLLAPSSPCLLTERHLLLYLPVSVILLKMEQQRDPPIDPVSPIAFSMAKTAGKRLCLLNAFSVSPRIALFFSCSSWSPICSLSPADVLSSLISRVKRGIAADRTASRLNMT